MEEVLLELARECGLSPFHEGKGVAPRISSSSLFRTPDARSIHGKVIQTLSASFLFSDTKALWSAFPPTLNTADIERRQAFFGSLAVGDRSFLSKLCLERSSWRPPYGVMVATEDEKLFSLLKERDCPVTFLISEYDIQKLEHYDVVQVLGCDTFGSTLERLPQSVFLNDVDEAYLERHVETLSSWKSLLTILHETHLSGRIGALVTELVPLLSLCEQQPLLTLTREQLERGLTTLNESLSTQLRSFVLTGDSLLALVHKERLPPELQAIVRSVVRESGFPEHLFTETIPLQLQEQEVDHYLKKHSARAYTTLAERIRSHAHLLCALPERLASLSQALLLYDFMSGIALYCTTTTGFPHLENQIKLIDACSLFLSQPQPISFLLDHGTQCSILTGANSGGKTTLLEHLVQLVSLQQLGLPVRGLVSLPLFTEVYYFAKNKGSANKGAFETLLHQLASIAPQGTTLILADEIEAVTEPGVAGRLICATIDYFLHQNCFLVIATHLGQEIQALLPAGSRIDGIEAKGLTDSFDLIVDHTPVLGRLARSTPELIIQRLAHISSEPYYAFLAEALSRYHALDV
jgi:DNA mismatch repair protein MutS2